MVDNFCPLITVVMPAYNASAYISETVHSILNQDFENFELIITDDCSTDNTVEIVKSFDDNRIKLIRTDSNSGSAKYPRELAIENGSAPYVCWIDSDDIVDSDYLSKLYQRKEETGADIVCSQMFAERKGQVDYTLPRQGFDFAKILKGKDACLLTLSFPWEINLNGWLCNRDLWLNVSTFKSLTINHMDADDFSAREMLFKASKVAFSPAVYHYRLHPEAITKKISPKLFESIITWDLLFDYFQNHWSEVLPIARNSLCHRMIALLRLYAIHEDELSLAQRCESKLLLRKYFKKINLTDVYRTNLPHTQKLILTMPFESALQVIKLVNR